MSEIINLIKYNHMNQSSKLLSNKDILDIITRLFSKDEGSLWECIDVYRKHEKDIGLFADILSCAGNRARCESLLVSLDEEQLRHFSKIVISLKESIEFEDFSKAHDSTFNLNTPTESTIKKAATLLDMNKKIGDRDFDWIIGGLIKFSCEIKHLAQFYHNYKVKSNDEQWTNGLARLPEEDPSIILFF